jgi:hypothetical protein
MLLLISSDVRAGTPRQVESKLLRLVVPKRRYTFERFERLSFNSANPNLPKNLPLKLQKPNGTTQKSNLFGLQIFKFEGV